MTVIVIMLITVKTIPHMQTALTQIVCIDQVAIPIAIATTTTVITTIMHLTIPLMLIARIAIADIVQLKPVAQHGSVRNSINSNKCLDHDIRCSTHVKSIDKSNR